MSNFKSLLRTLFFAALWLLASSCALAQPASSGSGSRSTEAGGMDYTGPYVIVILLVALGILVVARASKRRDRQSPGGYVEKNILGDD